jgi:hypothetical protein
MVSVVIVGHPSSITIRRDALAASGEFDPWAVVREARASDRAEAPRALRAGALV